MVFTTTLSFAQVLGIYEFTGHVCATPVVGVTAQPANAVFSDYTRVGANCTAAANVFNTTAWTVSPTLDPAKYLEFTVTPNACTVMNLDSLKFLHRVSTSGGAVTVVVRSSLDGYTSDIHNAPITAVNSDVTLGIDLPAAFMGLSGPVTFRTYVVNILAVGATYRHDNVRLIGTATTYALANYYADADGDGFGNAAVFVNTCTPPAGYVANSTDCNDNNNAIGAGIVFYQDFDNDGFGNPAMTQTACTQPVGYVANDDDCNDNDNGIGVATTTYYQDFDNDGFGNASVTQVACTQPVGYVSNDDDCNDNDNAIGVATTTYYQDLDNDTYGNFNVTLVACTQPAGYVSNDDDCDDNNNAIHPGATETCDGVDNDCFGGIDDNVTTLTWYQDLDNDGLGNPAVTQDDCAQPVGYVANDDDCDDNNNAIGVASTTYYLDTDNDGFGNAAVTQIACTQPVGYVSNDDDCDDNNNAVGAAQTWYADTDNDTYGNPNVSVVACTQPANHVANNTDCDDTNNGIHPGATEIPDNGIDEDCVGGDLNTVGGALGMYTFTGNTCATPVLSVTAQPANATFSDYSADSVTCATGTDFFNHSGWNIGSTIDLTEFYEFTITPDNCYELELTQLSFLHRVSNSAGSPFIHVRSSLDNYASDIFSTQITTPGVNINETVTLPAAFASITGPVTFRFYVVGIAASGATYRNDNVTVTGFINALPTQTYHADADGDGYGDMLVFQPACTQPAGYVLDNTDCDDTNADAFPGAIWYQDLDNDTYGNSAVSLTQCTQPAGYVADDTDCDDNNNAVGGSVIYYADTDNDGFGDAGNTTAACTPPAGYVTNDDDCDDTDNQIGLPTNQYFLDADTDGFGSNVVPPVTACTAPNGYVANNWDCDDNDNTITIAETEVFEDADGDGFGNANSSVIACDVFPGYVLDSTDCDDTDEDINPDATDALGDGIDDNCDGTDGNLGLGELDNAAVAVFPNPGTTSVTVSLNGSWSATEIAILSVDGKTVQTLKPVMVNGTATIATEGLQPSVYFIQVTDGARKAVVRWVKQ